MKTYEGFTKIFRTFAGINMTRCLVTAHSLEKLHQRAWSGFWARSCARSVSRNSSGSDWDGASVCVRCLRGCVRASKCFPLRIWPGVCWDRKKHIYVCLYIVYTVTVQKNVFYLCVNEEGECSNTSGPGTNTGSSLAESESALLRCRALRSPSTSQGSRGGVRGAGGSWREIRGRFRVESRPKSAQKRDWKNTERQEEEGGKKKHTLYIIVIK